jgi:peptidoglycan/LPS O-acetylase OafA/YrhL
MPPVTATAENTSRILGIDRLKGTLILLILFYHSLNYSQRYYLGFKLLGWAPVSFILVTGLLVSYIYSLRFAQAPLKISRRLWSRAGKLVLLFTFLNFGISLLRKPPGQSPSECIQAFLSHWWEVYVTGEGRYASFQILLPIAYFLVVSPALLSLNGLSPILLPVLCALILPTMALLDEHNRLWTNLALISASLPGLLAGRVPIQSYDKLSLHLGALGGGYCAIFAFGAIFGQSYLLQILGACSGLALAYSLCQRWEQRAPRRGLIALLGEYSLLAYILQIAALQALVRVLGRPEPFSARFLLLLAGAGAVMGALIVGIHWSRSRSRRAAELYKAVFA